jgi:tripartite-type tricarboxylate transporter receptor subunit TctC
MNSLSRSLFAALTMSAAASAAWAQEYPAKPIRFILPFTNNPAIDAQVRAMANQFKERAGWTIVIDYIAGGNFIPGTMAMLNAPADGHTMMFMPQSLTAIQNTAKDLPFNVQRDIAPVSRIVRFENVLAVNPSLPAKTLDELIAYSKANPGKLSYGGTGTGTVNHLVGESFRRAVGLDMVYVPYQRTSALPDLLGGTLQAGILLTTDAVPNHQAGKLRILVALQKDRLAALPDVPATGDHPNPVVKQQDFPSWGGLGMKAGTPPQILRAMHRELTGVMQMQDVRDVFRKVGAIAMVESTEDFKARIELDISRWAKVIKDANLKFD